MRAYLDSCVVIYLLEGPAELRSAVEKAVGENPEAQFLVSDLVRLECRTGPLKCSDTRALGLFDAFFEHTIILDLTPRVFDVATQLRAQHGLRTPDALHLATASVYGCDEFWTGDTRLAAIAASITFRVFP